MYEVRSTEGPLGGLVVLSCLPLDLRLVGSNPAENDIFLRKIKICSTTSFVREVKPSAPCRKILRHAKDPCGV
jgi:hypothetical protein